MRNVWLTRLAVAVLATQFSSAVFHGALAGEEASAGVTILDTKSFWRFRTVLETPEQVLPSGEVKHLRTVGKGNIYEWFRKNPTKGQPPEDMYEFKEVDSFRLPEETSAGWMKPEFDDSAWARVRGPMLAGSNSEAWKLILMRGRFEVVDPAKAGDLTLSLDFRGGTVVYLNGEEVVRAALPKGDLPLYAPAEPYPEEVYFSAEGFALTRGDRSPDGKPASRRGLGRSRTASSRPGSFARASTSWPWPSTVPRPWPGSTFRATRVEAISTPTATGPRSAS